MYQNIVYQLTFQRKKPNLLQQFYPQTIIP